MRPRSPVCWSRSAAITIIISCNTASTLITCVAFSASSRNHQSLSVVINKLKSNISREVCSEFGRLPPLWATGYLARSVGRVRIQAVKKYVAHQAEHHGIVHG